VQVDKLGAVLRELRLPQGDDAAEVTRMGRAMDSGNMVRAWA